MKTYTIWDKVEGYEYIGEQTLENAKAIVEEYVVDNSNSEYTCYLFELLPVCSYTRNVTVSISEQKFTKIHEE